MTTALSRQPAGIPVGGQFAATAHAEPDGVSLSAAPAPTPFEDADGTTWEFEGDEYTEIYQSSVGGVRAEVRDDIRAEGVTARIIDFRGTRPLVLGRNEHFDSLDEGKAHAKGLREQALRYRANTVAEGSRSPWGKIQSTSPLAAGIDAVFTAGHGGLKLSPERAREVDPGWREGAGWYEEDCAWSKAAITHYQDLEPDYVADAHETARRWYPDEYTKLVGKDPSKYGLIGFEPITAAESHIVETREFMAARADTHVRVDAVNLTPAGHPGMVEVKIHDLASDGKDDEGTPAVNPRVLLVPEDEWDMPYTERRTFPKASADRFRSPTAS